MMLSVLQLKAEKADKKVIEAEVAKLLALKKDAEAAGVSTQPAAQAKPQAAAPAKEQPKKEAAKPEPKKEAEPKKAAPKEQPKKEEPKKEHKGDEADGDDGEDEEEGDPTKYFDQRRMAIKEMEKKGQRLHVLFFQHLINMHTRHQPLSSQIQRHHECP